jgi:ABC-type amino acid transport system permease subunit
MLTFNQQNVINGIIIYFKEMVRNGAETFNHSTQVKEILLLVMPIYLSVSESSPYKLVYEMKVYNKE